jgi:inositol phosphorylceramide synthase regulatory subunit
MISLSHSRIQKFYFAALLYSFAHHLRRGSYRSLPLSRHHMHGMILGGTPVKDFYSPLPALDVENGEDGIDADVDSGSFYGAPPPLPVHTIPSPSAVTNGNATSAHRSRGTGAGSTGSFADFVSAPPPRRSRRTRGSLLAGGTTRSGSTSGSVAGSSSTGPSEGEEDESSSAGTGSSRVRA